MAGRFPREFTPPTQWGVFVSYGELAAASALVGVTLNHRLHAPTDFERSQADVAAAIDYVREHAAELNVDADRIALWYFSGGGPLLSAVLRDRPSYVRCVLAFYAFLDLRHMIAAMPTRRELRVPPSCHLPRTCARKAPACRCSSRAPASISR